MLIYLDSNVVIYLVEQFPRLGELAAARVSRLRREGHRLAVSPVVRMECRVRPLALGDQPALREYDRFFTSPRLEVLDVTPPVWDRAAQIRAAHRLAPLDALHLAAAIEGGCGLLLTNDVRLGAFPDLVVEVLS